jgi:hypothetical protein
MSEFHITERGGASTAKSECQRRHLLAESQSAAASARAAVRWRKLLLRRRWELSFVCESFAQMWSEYFPHHDCVTLQFKRTAQSRAESYWQGESWKKAARWYRDNRQDRTLITEPDPQPVRRVRRLLSNDVSLDAVWRELNAPENRPTPQVTTEAIWLAVRERGLGALQEPATLERLARCDQAALAEIDRRINRLKARG